MAYVACSSSRALDQSHGVRSILLRRREHSLSRTLKVVKHSKQLVNNSGNYAEAEVDISLSEYTALGIVGYSIENVGYAVHWMYLRNETTARIGLTNPTAGGVVNTSLEFYVIYESS